MTKPSKSSNQIHKSVKMLVAGIDGVRHIQKSSFFFHLFGVIQRLRFHLITYYLRITNYESLTLENVLEKFFLGKKLSKPLLPSVRRAVLLWLSWQTYSPLRAAALTYVTVNFFVYQLKRGCRIKANYVPKKRKQGLMDGLLKKQ